jgi:hypothetical protein
MDPSALSNLDPKLRETYEKVMGTNTAPPADPQPPQAADGQQTTQSPEQNASSATEAPASSTPTQADASASSENATSVNPAPASDGLSEPIQSPPPQDTMQSSEGPQTVTINQPVQNSASTEIITKPQGHMGLIKVFYVLGATVFFVIYIFFWMKIFNLSLPF